MRYTPLGIRDTLKSSAEVRGDFQREVACFRRVSVLFVNLGAGGRNLSFRSGGILALCQELFNSICAIIYENEGSVRQFIMDDKGE